jgi:hypothetical protein
VDTIGFAGSVLFVAFVGTCVAWWIFGRDDVATAPSQDPRAVLATRLTQGEISREEFDTAMRALGFGAPPPEPPPPDRRPG